MIWFEVTPEEEAELRVPPYEEDRLPNRPHSEHLTDALDEAAKQAVSETDKERV